QPAAFFEVLGWIVGDGTLSGGKYPVITQKKPDGVRALRAALQAAGLSFAEYPSGRYWGTKFYIHKASAKDILAYLPNKRPTMAWLTAASAEQLEAFLRGAVASDGHHSAQYSGQVLFYNNDIELCRLVQLAAALLGRRTTLRVKAPAKGKRQT